jgi:aryl-alcohol dehydrogenase-like predicted oxidoreductase
VRSSATGGPLGAVGGLMACAGVGPAVGLDLDALVTQAGARLRPDWIGLYQMHHIDRDCPGGEAWQAFGALVGQGKVAYVGSGIFAGWDIATVALAWLLHNPAVTPRRSSARATWSNSSAPAWR